MIVIYRQSYYIFLPPLYAKSLEHLSLIQMTTNDTKKRHIKVISCTIKSAVFWNVFTMEKKW